MKKFLLILALLPTLATAETVYWTGGLRYTTSVTGKDVLACEYLVGIGRYVWALFPSNATCPQSIEVE